MFGKRYIQSALDELVQTSPGSPPEGCREKRREKREGKVLLKLIVVMMIIAIIIFKVYRGLTLCQVLPQDLLSGLLAPPSAELGHSGSC